MMMLLICRWLGDNVLFVRNMGGKTKSEGEGELRDDEFDDDYDIVTDGFRDEYGATRDGDVDAQNSVQQTKVPEAFTKFCQRNSGHYCKLALNHNCGLPVLSPGDSEAKPAKSRPVLQTPLFTGYKASETPRPRFLGVPDDSLPRTGFFRSVRFRGGIMVYHFDFFTR